MTQLTYSQIQEKLASSDYSSYSPLRISILRNITLEPIEPFLKYFLGEAQLKASLQFGAYDQILQESMAPSSDFIDKKTDVVLVFNHLDTFSPTLAQEFNSLSPEKVQEEVKRAESFSLSVISSLRKKTDALILWHEFLEPAYSSSGISKLKNQKNQIETIRHLNDVIRNSIHSLDNIYVVDLNSCRNRIGEEKFKDPRYWHIGKAPYSREGLKEVALEDVKYIRAAFRKNKKCLVLDCDNTLWGGILGEDGLDGIKLSKTFPGSAYNEFQKEILNLYHRGIILALCSKNNEKDVWEVFQKNPDMVLKEKHIAAFQINWNDKGSNIKKIAETLNIGIDSMVLMDDSPFEINLVRGMHPDISVVDLSTHNPEQFKTVLASCGFFETLTLTGEDKKRGQMYKAETQRKDQQAQFENIQDYYRSLEMELTIQSVGPDSVSRVSQLTQRTNQFNLTTKRYSESEIQKLIRDPNSEVYQLHLKDKFGDYGTVGLSILVHNGEKTRVDEFLLSCRVLGRGVEDVLLNFCLKRGIDLKKKVLVGEYVPTPKNDQVKDFYLKHGFKELNKGISECSLEKLKIKNPEFFKKVNWDKQ